MARLPPELIDLIFGYLLLDLDGTPNHGLTGVLDLERSTTLLKFGMACRAFYQLALPHVYHKFGCDHRGPITPLRVLECFMEQPKQALLIHELHTEMVENLPREQHQEPNCWGYRPRAGLSLRICKLLLSFDISDELKEDLFTGLVDGYDDAETAMILCMCDNFRVWKTRIGDSSPQQLTGEDDLDSFPDCLENKVIREARTPGSRLLQQLCEVHVQFDYKDPDNPYWMFEDAQDILMLPSLRRLTIRRFGACSPLRLSAPVRSEVEHLDLQKAWFDGIGLCELLKSCPRLKTLSVYRKDLVEPSRFANFMMTSITYAGVGDALREHGTDLIEFEWKENPNALYQFPIGNLSSLTALEVLSLPLEALGPSHGHYQQLQMILPTLLTDLTITDAGTHASDNVLHHTDRKALSLMLPGLMVDERHLQLSTIRTSHFEKADLGVLSLEPGWKNTSSEQDRLDGFVVLTRSGHSRELSHDVRW